MGIKMVDIKAGQHVEGAYKRPGRATNPNLGIDVYAVWTDDRRAPRVFGILTSGDGAGSVVLLYAASFVPGRFAVTDGVDLSKLDLAGYVVGASPLTTFIEPVADVPAEGVVTYDLQLASDIAAGFASRFEDGNPRVTVPTLE